MAHAQKPDFVFRLNGRVHLNRPGASVQSTTGSRGVRISGSNAGYTTFRGSAKSTGYPLHSPVSPSLPLPCVTVCHHISTGVYSEVHAVPDGWTDISLESSGLSTVSESDGITSMYRRSLISELAALAAAPARSTEQLRIRNGYEMFC